MAKLTIKAVADALEEKGGNFAAVARALGVSRVAVWKFVQKHDDLKQLAHDQREGMKDNAESSLHKAIMNGEAWAVCFFLKTQAKDRGYIERKEVTGKDGNDLPSTKVSLTFAAAVEAAAEVAAELDRQERDHAGDLDTAAGGGPVQGGLPLPPEPGPLPS